MICLIITQSLLILWCEKFIILLKCGIFPKYKTYNAQTLIINPFFVAHKL